MNDSYSDERNALISEAEMEAYIRVGPSPAKRSGQKYETWKNDWDREFLDAMQDLAYRYGLSPSPSRG